jgi:hypothetical protein
LRAALALDASSPPKPPAWSLIGAAVHAVVVAAAAAAVIRRELANTKRANKHTGETAAARALFRARVRVVVAAHMRARVCVCLCVRSAGDGQAAMAIGFERAACQQLVAKLSQS